ncbi:hypothetical protein [Enterococcus gallinarum]|uniref:CAP-Gly protein n=1 Tax=Enterococcus gallinarum TaxID=1353 RepID=A0ABD4HRW8_ENTGA|nr:hypothetical protein [Enterococcus gallinarum]MBA0949917.1 hypothetical protein [Enterococcus gallinarum]MBA0962874.1 hypothetical protein [Enterococcus gallinarum]MBA0970810.1 hypothetical protein [Enterococcus gallinarum]MBA0974245.1 hypothetical protein [Enterococcus gallinarum]NVI93668.1 hypothetical protein [Enterococcus gallinarum]
MKHGFRDYLGANEREAGYNLSWGSIFAGVVTFIALFMTFSLIGSAIGFGMVEPTSNNPLDGVGTGLMIWTVVTLILSLFSAGFVSGVAARRVGLVHGFLTWATSMIVTIVMLSYLTIGAFSVVGSLLGNIASAVGSGVENVASGTADVASKAFDEITGNMGDIDTDQLQTDVRDVLKDTDVPELQPNYLQDQVFDATRDITDAGKKIATDPNKADEIIDDLSTKLQDRATKISDSVDEDAISNAVAKNTDLNQQEAQEATQNIVNGLQKASDEAQQQIETAQQNLEQAKQDIDQAVKDARKKADEVSDATAKASIWGFVAMVLGLVLTSIGGMVGANLVKTADHENRI